jgi:glycosyltransferase involved in cell wall biosynthesis
MPASSTVSKIQSCSAQQLSACRYVLVTPARNEASFIERTLQSVTRQSLLPKKWVVVSDGSTDGTDDIVAKYVAQHKWIELIRMSERSERHFAGKVYAFNAGYQKVKGLDYDFIGCMDGDISFDEDYFSFLLRKLIDHPGLGLVGTPFREEGGMYDYRFVSIEHVSGACQLFRRECFEDIGGYVPMKGGGVDHVAVITARMKGWQTRTFTDKVCFHHRKMGAAKHGACRMKFEIGKLDYTLGGHPLWEMFRSVYQLTKSPVIVGGAMIFAGYFWSALCRSERPVSAGLVEFRRSEQMKRLRRFFLGGNRLSAATDANPGEPIKSSNVHASTKLQVWSESLWDEDHDHNQRR